LAFFEVVMLARTVLLVLIFSLSCSCGCQSNKTPVKSVRYRILQSGTPNELHIQPVDKPYALVISPWEKGHEIVVIPRGNGDLQPFRSKKLRFWMEGNEVKVEVLEQGVIDAGEI
jgi:hypothetical protein